MVMNKAAKSKSKAPARKAAALTQKTTKSSVKATSNGHKDSEEPQDTTEMSSNVVDGDAIQSVELAANGKEPNVINSDQQTSNAEVQPNSNDSKSDETPETVKSQRKKAKTEIVDTKEETPTLPSSKIKGQQKKEIKMETEEVSKALPTSESESEPASKTLGSRKRKAPEEPEQTAEEEPGQTAEEEPEQTVEDEPKADVGPSTLPSKSRKKKVDSTSKEASSSKVTSAKDKRTVSAPKTKLKRQKVVLDIPPARAIAGKVFVIGANDVGQLGLEGVEMKKRPAMLDLPHSFVDISAGGMHSVCLTERGEVITFGCNDEGALGRITVDDSLEVKPLKVEIPEKVVQISAGDSHSAALTESGHVYLWGNFRSGDGPMGLTVDRMKKPTPIRILNDVTVVKISSGTEHLACLSNDGLIYTLGCAENGQLGRIPKHNCHDGGRKGLASLLNPAQVHVGNRRVPIDDVWTGSYNTFMKAQETGSIYAFGLNNYQQLGCEKKNVDDNFLFTPKQIKSFSSNTWLRITGGLHHSLALDNNGSVYSLGRRDYGMLGLGEGCEEKSVPTVIPTLQNEKCTEISCGTVVSFALTEEGSVFSWGMGDNHQLGHGSEEDSHVPEAIKGNFLDSWKAHKVSGGGQHTLILAVPKENPKSDKKK